MSSVKTDSCETESVNDDGKMAEVSQTNIIKLIDKLFFAAATDDLASKELWKQEKKLRFLIRRCCKVKRVVAV